MRYIGTFKLGTTLEGQYAEIEACSENEAVACMNQTFGDNWCAAYTKTAWQAYCHSFGLALERLNINNRDLFVVLSTGKIEFIKE
jgi:hypothetical protein